VPRELAEAVARALMLEPTARYQTADAFALALAAAARACGTGVADARRVRSFVQPMIAPTLEARRAKVSRVLARRGRVGDGPLPSGAEPTLRTERLVSREAETIAVQPPPSSPPSGALTETERLDSQTGQTGSLDAVLRASGVPPAALLTAPLRSRVWLLVAIVPAVVLLLVWSVTGNSSSSSAAPGAAASSAIGAEPPPPLPEPEIEDVPVEVITPSELALESAEPGRAKKPAYRPPTRGQPPATILESEPPMPAPNPYPKKR
jgi:hypothetical protein